jgi:hypothetical protein
MLERWTSPKGRWCGPRKMFEYYVNLVVPDFQEGKKQLHSAVIGGEIRSRWQGTLLGPERLKEIAKMTFDDDDPYALPWDLELSLEDARRKWFGE